MRFVYGLFGILTGIVTGAAINGLSGRTKMITIIVSGSMAFLLGIWILLYEISKKVWPAKSNWTFRTNDSVFPEAVCVRGGKVCWQGAEPQKEGMFYELNMQKERVISGLHFDQGSSNSVPAEWEITFFDKIHGYVIPNKDTTKPFVKGKDSIIILELERLVQAQFVRVEIKKARMRNNNTYDWLIEDIGLRENRLFNRWWRVIIR